MVWNGLGIYPAFSIAGFNQLSGSYKTVGNDPFKGNITRPKKD